MTDELSRIRFVATNYSRLQGLREVPVGMLVVFVAVWAMYNQGPTADLTAPLLVTFGAAILYWLTDRYYSRAFGQVKQTRRQRNREILASVTFGMLALLAFWLDTAVDMPVSALGLVFAAALLENFWQVTSSVRKEAVSHFPENFVAAILILLVSILPVFGLNWWQALGMKSQMVSVFLVIGIVLILAGIWGHIRLVRVLSAAEAKSHDNAV